jgi:hypothetical protein
MNMNPQLDNWYISVPDDGYTALERRKSKLCGVVHNHPEHKDGSRITTSTILSISIEKKEARTRSRTYSLGNISSEWEQWLQLNNYTVEDFITPILHNRAAVEKDASQDR